MAKRGIKEIQEKGKNFSNIKMEKALVENFISLQQVMTNLAIKFDNLAGQISKLLELFEISAKALAEKEQYVGDDKANKRVMDKLDNLLEQNKVIARGLSLLHERSQPQQMQYQPPMPMQREQIQQQPKQSRVVELERYQKPNRESLNPKFRNPR